LLEHSYVLPASFGQVRLWLLDQVQPGNPVYNTVSPLRIRGPLEVEPLQQALHTVVDRHEVLRTVFRIERSDVVTVVAARRVLPLDLIDLSDSPDDLHGQLRRLATRPFDLAVGPLVRCHLIRLAAHEHILVVVMHHAIGDPRSCEILANELAAGYLAHLAGEEPRLPELTIQYPDFAAWQRQVMDSGVLSDRLERWRERLTGAHPLRLPTDLPRPARPTHEAVTVPLEVPADTVRRLRGLGGGVTDFMVAMAAYTVLLAHWSGQPDIVVAFPADGRDQPELEHMVGYFVNTLPVRIDVSGDPSFNDLLRRVRSACLQTYADAAVPFEKIVEALAPDRESGRMPLAQAWLVLQEPVRMPHLPDLVLEPVPLVATHLPFDVALSLRLRPDQALTGDLAAAAELFRPETVRLAADSLCALLDAAAAAPERPISTLPIRLPAPAAAAAVQTAPSAGTQTSTDGSATEHALRRLWSEVLEVDQVAADDEFYGLGGDSLRAVRVVLQARELGLELPMDVVLAEHTLRQLTDATEAVPPHAADAAPADLGPQVLSTPPPPGS
jgi:hypothetical protein